MKRAILISIKPFWVEKILDGSKIIEIRKGMPKCDLPCKVYIYETKGKGKFINCGRKRENIGGKVVAEFTLNKVDCLKSVRYKLHGTHYQYNEVSDEILRKSCLTQEQVLNYTNSDDLYAWHIDDLKIYKEPKELGEFRTLPCMRPETACAKCKYLEVTNTPYAYETYCPIENGKILKKPPQSYMYVEELI